MKSAKDLSLLLSYFYMPYSVGSYLCYLQSVKYYPQDIRQKE